MAAGWRLRIDREDKRLPGNDPDVLLDISAQIQLTLLIVEGRQIGRR